MAPTALHHRLVVGPRGRRARDRRDGLEAASPRALLPHPWPDLAHLPGFAVELPGPPDVPYSSPEFREAAFLLYLWAHHPVRDVTIGFGHWSKAGGIGFRFQGTVDLREDRFPNDTTVSVDGLLMFDGCWSRTRELVAAEDRLARSFDGSRFGDAEALEDRGTFFRYRGCADGHV